MVVQASVQKSKIEKVHQNDDKHSMGTFNHPFYESKVFFRALLTSQCKIKFHSQNDNLTVVIPWMFQNSVQIFRINRWYIIDPFKEFKIFLKKED